MIENRYLNSMAQLCGPYVRNFKQGKLGNFFWKERKNLLVGSPHSCPAVKDIKHCEGGQLVWFISHTHSWWGNWSWGGEAQKAVGVGAGNKPGQWGVSSNHIRVMHDTPASGQWQAAQHMIELSRPLNLRAWAQNMLFFMSTHFHFGSWELEIDQWFVFHY